MEIVLNDKFYSNIDEIRKSVGYTDVVSFLAEWFDDREYVIGHTSGSTGVPKEVCLLKSDMKASARLTNEFFGVNNSSLISASE